MIMAGGRSVGTGAACLAGTHPTLIQQIRSRLPRDVELADKSTVFWVLVHGQYSDRKQLLKPKDVEIVEVGKLPRIDQRAVKTTST